MSTFHEEASKDFRTAIVCLTAFMISLVSSILIYNLVHPNPPEDSTHAVARYCYEMNGYPSLNNNNVTCERKQQ